MNPIIFTIGAIWLAGMFFAWALVHGAEKLRRQHEAAPVVTFERPAGGFIEVVASPYVVGAS